MLTKLIPVAALALQFVVPPVTAETPSVELREAYPSLTFERPLFSQTSPADGREYLVEQGGRIWILPRDRSTDDRELFLDISDRKPWKDNEEGLLGFDFHPQFAANGKFYIYYTQHDPRRSVVSELVVNEDSTADLESERVLMEIPQPFGNHNSGPVEFGPDGMFYIATGDGGAANDPHGNGQNLKTLLGKVLRIDVDNRTGELPYGIPRDNPFLHLGDDARAEIWAFGLRNPWRMSFDRETGDLWLADVGQNKWEEINLIVKGGNYGWNTWEGFHLFKEPASAAVNAIMPVIEYPHLPLQADEAIFEHTTGLSVTGGFVYRGEKLPSLRGVYVYADFANGTIWGLRYAPGKVTPLGVLIPPVKDGGTARAIAGFGETADGELLIMAFDGKVYEFIEK